MTGMAIDIERSIHWVGKEDVDIQWMVTDHYMYWKHYMASGNKALKVAGLPLEQSLRSLNTNCIGITQYLMITLQKCLSL